MRTEELQGWTGADMCGSVVADQVWSFENACSVVSPELRVRHLVYDNLAHPLSVLKGPAFWAFAHMMSFGEVGSPGPAGQGESK